MPLAVAPGYCLVNPDDGPSDDLPSLGVGRVVEIPAGVSFPSISSRVLYDASRAIVHKRTSDVCLFVPIDAIVAVKT